MHAISGVIFHTKALEKSTNKRSRGALQKPCPPSVHGRLLGWVPRMRRRPEAAALCTPSRPKLARPGLHRHRVNVPAICSYSYRSRTKEATRDHLCIAQK